MRLSSEISARISNASLIAALMVVAIHVIGNSASCPERIVRDVARVSVPYFFVVSGFFIAGHATEAGWWGRAARKRAWSLGLPYVIWSALFAVMTLAGKSTDLSSWWAAKRWLIFGFDVTDTPLLMPLWYLRTLMLLVLGSGGIVAAVRWKPCLTLGLIGLVYVAFSVVVEIRPEVVASGVGAALRQTFHPEALFYFALGCTIGLKEVGLRCGWLLPGVIGLGLVIVRNLASDILPVWAIPYPVVIPFVMLSLWKLSPQKAWTPFVALAFPIYLMHYFVIKMAEPMLATFGGRAVVCLLAIALPALVVWCLRRLSPKLMGILFGGRG